MSTYEKKSGWKRGQSGNPNGRPIGSGVVAQLRASIAARLPEILEALVKKALEGDVGAAKLLLERTLAPLKPEQSISQIQLPDGSYTLQGQAILNLMAKGNLSPSHAEGLLNALAALVKLHEVDDLNKRICALEEAA